MYRAFMTMWKSFKNLEVVVFSLIKNIAFVLLVEYVKYNNCVFKNYH